MSNPRVFVLIEREDSAILLIKENSRRWKDKWYLPGGQAEDGESLEEAACRETKEESGHVIRITGCWYILYGTGNSDLRIFCSGKITGGELKSVSNKESQGAQWFTREEIKELDVRDGLHEVLSEYDNARCSLDPSKIIFQPDNKT